MKDINLKVTIDEANLILEALGNLPFNKVYALIGKMQEQARQQLGGDDSRNEERATESTVASIRE